MGSKSDAVSLNLLMPFVPDAIVEIKNSLILTVFKDAFDYSRCVREAYVMDFSHYRFERRIVRELINGLNPFFFFFCQKPLSC